MTKKKEARITHIPTLSGRSPSASKILDSLLNTHKEWINPITALISHPIYKWAEEQRKILNLDPGAIISSIQSEYDYFGLIQYETAVIHTKNLDISHKIAELTDFILSNPESELNDDQKLILSGIHGLQNKEVSLAKTNKYYEAAVIKMCTEYTKLYDFLVGRIYKKPENADADIAFIWHNTNLLIMICPTLKKEYGGAYNIQLGNAVQSIWDCVNSLQTYPFNGTEIYSIVKEFASGTKERAIAKQFNRTRDYINYRYAAGLAALSILLWGYVPLDVVIATKKLIQYK